MVIERLEELRAARIRELEQQVKDWQTNLWLVLKAAGGRVTVPLSIVAEMKPDRLAIEIFVNGDAARVFLAK